MSTNYNKMYNNAKNQEPETTVEHVAEPVIAPTVEEPAADVQMAIEGVAEPEVIADPAPDVLSAIVVGCAKLNVREEPSPRATVVAIIDASNEVIVHDSESFGNYYKICTASGIEGYCIKDYLSLK